MLGARLAVRGAGTRIGADGDKSVVSPTYTVMEGWVGELL